MKMFETAPVADTTQVNSPLINSGMGSGLGAGVAPRQWTATDNDD